jgi:hypothetical protein
MNFIRPTKEQIRNRAREIFIEHDSQPGHDVDNWLQAEYELTQLPVHKIAELAPLKFKQDKVHKSPLVFLVHAALLLEANGLTQYLGL